METFIAAVTPIYTIALGIIIPLAVGYGLKLLQDRTGVHIEQSDREALQTAIKNAALIAVHKTPGTATVTDVAIREGVKYVQTAVPDAVERFAKQGLTEEGIAKRIAPRANALLKASEHVVHAIEEKSEHTFAQAKPHVEAFIRNAIR